MMLSNLRIPGCESCWKVEDMGLSSRRTLMNSTDRVYDDVVSRPKTINLVLSPTCNQTCIYCGKIYSNSWLNDIIKNGDYAGVITNDNRYTKTDRDKVLYALSQKDLEKTTLNDLIMSQIRDCKEIDLICISGGEPFLDNSLVNKLKMVSHAKKIVIDSGLTVNHSRLIRLCDEISEIDHPDLVISLSIENLGKFHEFNRYGSKFDQWLENYDFIRKNFNHKFFSVVSNLTLFGLADFLREFSDHKIGFNLLTEPEFLRPHQLDNESKNIIIDQLNSLNRNDLSDIIDYIKQPSDDHQLGNLKDFFFEFAKRRELDVSIFPESFRNWLSIAS